MSDEQIDKIIYSSATAGKSYVDWLKENQGNPNVYTESMIVDIVDCDYEELSARYAMSNQSDKGFELTMGNGIYDMSEEELYEIAAIVYGEGAEASYDDYLAVASLMANRADSSGFPDTIIDVAHASGQFSAYLDRSDKYEAFKTSNGTGNEGMQMALEAVKDCFLYGVRNNDYKFFVANYCDPSWYGNNTVVDDGNRYSVDYIPPKPKN